MSTLVKVKSIVLGKNSTETYEWFGIHSVNWRDVTPWVHIDIPNGVMVHQHILSPHIEGEIKCKDLSTLHTALFTTIIDNNNHTAITTQTNRKYAVNYFNIRILNSSNELIGVLFDGFKVETLGIENIELGLEATWIIRFTADRMVIGDP